MTLSAKNTFALFTIEKPNPLARNIAQMANVSPVFVATKTFQNREIEVQLPAATPVTQHAVVVQSTPDHASWFSLLFTLGALHEKGYQKIVACTPYLGYARQDKAALHKNCAHLLTLKLLRQAGATHLCVLDPHREDAHRSLKASLPLVHTVSTTALFAADIQKRFKSTQNLAVVSPDQGGAQRAKRLANALCVPYIVGRKTSESSNIGAGTQYKNVCFGDLKKVHNKDIILLDDMVDSGATLKAAGAVLRPFTKTIHAYVTHAVLSDKTFDITSLFTSATCTNTLENMAQGMRVLCVAQPLCDVLQNVLQNTSQKALY